MWFADLLFSSRNWVWPAIGLLLVGLLFLAWNYARSPLPPALRLSAALLKALGFAALAFCLVEPLWSKPIARAGANFFAILADNSQGMQIRDRNETTSRGEQLRNLLVQPASEWQAQLEEHFQLRKYLVDSRLQITKDFAELTFDGRASALATALRNLADRYQGRPLAGLLFFTDGNATDLASGGLPELSGLPPVYPVVIGQGEPDKDIALQGITVTQTAFEDAPVGIQVSATAAGYRGDSIVAQLLTLDGKVVAETTETARRDPDSLTFRFQVRPEQPGISFYQIRAAAKPELNSLEKNQSSEATLANNSRIVVVDRGRGPHRMLYVAGRPNWEFKFLNRALAEDHEVHLVSLIRVARREPKFEFRGRGGESSNPLFRGFDRKTEETERYDQPVLVRLNTRDETELRGGFPKTAEDLYEYQAVILDDVEAEFFSRDQMVLLQKFVSERGGGFLMLGGQDSFQSGKFENTPIADLLPVYLDRAPSIAPDSGWRLDLTREGWLQPWVRLRTTEPDEQSRLQAMPEFQVINAVREFKPGASLLATVSDGAGKRHPALAVQRYGHGRSAALLIGDLWRWGFRDETLHQDMDKAWRQLIRWLIADVPRRLELQFEPASDPAAPARLLTRARDEKFDAIENASVAVQVQTISYQPAIGAATAAHFTTNQSVRIQAEPSATDAGAYEATFLPRDTGAFKATATVTDESGLALGTAETAWTADPAADEFRSLKPNRELLEQIARRTGGELVEPGNLAAFARTLPDRKAPITETTTFPVWHTPALFLFALACFIAEWGLRRWKGLA